MGAVEGAVGSDEQSVRRNAAGVAAAFAAALAMGIVLLVAFDPEVQRVEAGELTAREGDARAFFVADYVFILLYGVVSPIAIWRFGAALGGAPGWSIFGAVVLLPVAGLVDAIENTLLWSAAGSFSPETVDAAHSLAIPKVALFVAGTAFSIAVLVRAVRVLRAGRHD